MKLKSFAKVNLNLRVKKKNKDNLHNIETIAALLNLHDEIIIKKSNYLKDSVVVKGKFKKYVNPKKNTILDTLSSLKELGFIKKNYKIVIKKNIPVFAGLGGGTSNSFFIVKKFYKNEIPEQIKKKFEKKIGSDFRIFLNPWCFQNNISNVKKFKGCINLHFLLIYPNIKCSTKEVYSKVRSFGKFRHINVKKLENRTYLLKTLKEEKNDLQKIVEKKYPKIKKIINFISIQPNCIFTRMTGSGSVCFGVFRTKKSAKLATNMAKKRFPKYWCVTTKSI
jgi:4-diphosphocytidyl-2-C-methyl-D-erythritol kinase